MTAEENTCVVLRLSEEAWNRGNVDVPPPDE